MRASWKGGGGGGCTGVNRGCGRGRGCGCGGSNGPGDDYKFLKQQFETHTLFQYIATSMQRNHTASDGVAADGFSGPERTLRMPPIR